MTKKTEIFSSEFQGNLRECKQIIKGNYLHTEFEDGKPKLCDKFELALITPSEKDSHESVYRSLRLIDPAQLRLLIFDLIKAYFIFLKHRNDLTEFSLGYHVAIVQKKTMEIAKDVIRGEE